MKFWLTAFGAMMLFCPVSARAADATAFNPLTVSVEAQAISGVPVGTIIAWPVANNPEGWAEGNWLECNGQTISQAVYPELFALVGPQVPDLRGLFLRGHGGNSDALGVRQGDAIRNITGSFTGTYTGISGVFYRITGGDIKAGSEGELIGFDVSRQVPTANEDRPANQAVRYLIRAFP